MTRKIDDFLNKIIDVENKKSSDLIDYFVYFLTVVEGNNTTRPKEVESCYDLANMVPYSNISSYLGRHCKKQRNLRPKFLKSKSGFSLERNYRVQLESSLQNSPSKIQACDLLHDLLNKLHRKEELSFLKEAIDCYQIGAVRASIVMTWILTLNHMQEYVLNHQLSSFNNALLENKDKRIKIKKISKIDDFSEIPEGKFVEFLRSSSIITKDVRKIMDEKLSVRNTAAHPSNIFISEVKATDFIIDLINNVILKHKI